MTEAGQPGTLHELLAAGERLPPVRALALVRAVALAVDALHAHQLVHGALSPSAVQVDGEDRVTISPSPPGDEPDPPRAYWSPQREAGEPARQADDLYALGLIAAALLAGPPDRPADPPLPPALEAVLRAQRSRAPSERFASGAELAAELYRAAAPALTPATSGPPPLPLLLGRGDVDGVDVRAAQRRGLHDRSDEGWGENVALPGPDGRAIEPPWAAARRVAQARAAHRLVLAELPDRASRERIRTIVRSPVERRAYLDFPLSGGWVAVLVVVLCSVYLFPIYFMLFPHG